MKRTFSTLSVAAAICFAITPAASALSASQAKACNTLGADLQKRQAKAQKLAAERLSLLDEVEDAGDAWENTETLRNFGDAEAAEADANKATYDSLKRDLLAKEQTLQNLIASLNTEVDAYNAKCVKK